MGTFESPASPKIGRSGAPGSSLPLSRAREFQSCGLRFCRHVGGETGIRAEPGFLTNTRHVGLIQDSLTALGAAKDAVAGKIPHEMLLLDLYNALRPLDAITGATTTDDILNLIFSTFCIGK